MCDNIHVKVYNNAASARGRTTRLLTRSPFPVCLIDYGVRDLGAVPETRERVGQQFGGCQVRHKGNVGNHAVMWPTSLPPTCRHTNPATTLGLHMLWAALSPKAS